MDGLLLTSKDNISYSYGLLTETKTETYCFYHRPIELANYYYTWNNRKLFEERLHPTPAINSNMDEPGGVALEIVSCQTAANPGIFIIKPLSHFTNLSYDSVQIQ